MAEASPVLGYVGMGLDAVSTISGLFGLGEEERAQKEAAMSAIAFERMRFRMHEEDSKRSERDVLARQVSAYTKAGVDARSGSPMTVAEDTVIEFARSLERERLMSALEIQQIRKQSAASSRRSGMQKTGLALSGAATTLGSMPGSLKRKWGLE